MRIGIVNDMPMMVEALRRVLAQRPDYELIWIAQDGRQAVEMCAWQLPDIVLMDLVMPNLDGVEATRLIMQKTPCAILLVTANISANSGLIYQALGHGALDVITTPTMSGPHHQLDASALLTRIAQIDQMQRKRDPSIAGNVQSTAAKPDASTTLIAIGASAGGPAALSILLGKLPADFPAAIVIVQHIDAAFAQGMAEWLQRQCTLKVSVARDGDRPQAGKVLIAGTSDHLLLKGPDALGYASASPQEIYHPSIDVFFHSVARQWQGKGIGILLTGMGRDGAIGLKAMRDRGQHTIVQDRLSCTVYGMPKAAIHLHAATEILSIDSIAPRLRQLLEPKGQK